MRWGIITSVPTRRGGRVVEGAALEKQYARKGIVGSNPTLSASLSRDSSFRKTAEAVLLPASTRLYALPHCVKSPAMGTPILWVFDIISAWVLE